MTQTAIPLEAMSRDDLLEVAQVQQQQLHRIYTIIAISNRKLSSTSKLVHIAGDIVLSSQKPNEQGLKRFDREGAAKLIGMSDDAVGNTIKQDCARFGATYELVPYILESGQECKLSYIDPEESYWKAPQVADLAPENLRNLPGDTRRSCTCGGTMHKIKRVTIHRDTWECEDCHNKEVVVSEQQTLPTLKKSAVISVYTVGGDSSRDRDTNEPEKEQGPQVADLFENIPDELKALPQFVTWQYGKMRKNGKREKPPYTPLTGKEADVSKPNTWGTYGDVQASEKIGIVAVKENGYVWIDEDKCRNKDTGELSERGIELVTSIKTYWEVSPSGTGLRAVGKASLPIDGIRRGPTELYSNGHYLTLTGQHVPGTPRTIEPCQPQIDALYAQIADKKQAPMPPPCVITTSPPPDNEVLKKALSNEKTGETFKLLWLGKWEGVQDEQGNRRYWSQSEADLGFCRRLAYWTGKDAVMMDRLFRRSGMYRAERWDKAARSGETYGQGTIARALSAQWELAS